ncbi:ABC transporter substrate-binding protein [Rhodoblastus sp. 17X3]|uniref:ABC transporter substrate-binding protein n=1 Tax=Rhodoblastus sp. 17X3 TaxID=3047026 RepID=UPI0024B86CBA|nr:ABC transporter substrate-binding protein [Rhodoblastus sp. 17X3]MDI9848522.1 ABC transporter substrate-binding protein [Rhodoblastus sp. 17X3]
MKYCRPRPRGASLLRSGALGGVLLSLALSSAAWAGAETAVPPAAPQAEPAEPAMQKIVIGYLRRAEKGSAVSRLELPPENDGEAGALAGIDDDNASGEFLGQNFSLVTRRLKPGEDAAQALAELAGQGVKFVIADLPAGALVNAADLPAAANLLIFNVGAPDDILREEFCRANVIHVAPTRSMLADGLAQYLIWKQWRKWFFVVGSHPEDKLWADALKRAGARFGAKFVEERVFEDRGGARRSDSGVALVQKQIPTFTQGVAAYDVLIAADENAVFADYLPFRTWDPRPVAGSAGLVSASWDASNEQWGATQLQQRFERKFGRAMTPLDMNSWTAARMVGEAAAHDAAGDAAAMKAYFLSKDFALAAFKGQKLTLRDWNLQLRQPILLSDGRNVVATSPQEGFMHQFSELDTLGYDRPESKCRFK